MFIMAKASVTQYDAVAHWWVCYSFKQHLNLFYERWDWLNQVFTNKSRSLLFFIGFVNNQKNMECHQLCLLKKITTVSPDT